MTVTLPYSTVFLGLVLGVDFILNSLPGSHPNPWYQTLDKTPSPLYVRFRGDMGPSEGEVVRGEKWGVGTHVSLRTTARSDLVWG